MKPTKVNILDFIDFKKFDTLLEGFNKSTGFVTAILDLDGNILSKSGWRQICNEFHRINPETLKKCTFSDTVLSGKMDEGEQYHYYKCSNGLIDVAVPVIIDGKHMANLFSGQFFFEEPDRMFFKKQAKEYGFDEEKYLEALEKVPVVSKERVKMAMEFLLNMTQLISETTFQRLEQQSLNDAILKGEERFKTFMEETPVYAYIKDGSLNHIFSNKKVRELSQLNQIGQTADSSRTLFDPEIADYLENADQKILSGDSNRIELEYKVKIGGRDTWLHDIKFALILTDGTKGVGGLAIDITERKRAETALRESEAMLQTAMDCSPSGIAIADAPDGRLRYVNDAGLFIRGGERDSLVKDVGIEQYVTSWQLLDFDGRPLRKDEVPLARALMLGETNNRDFIIRRKEGESRIVSANAAPIRNEAGEITAAMVVFSDITERKQAEAEILLLNAELEQRVAERTFQLEAANKELEAFSYSVSHDLRAPLRHINGYVGLLNKGFRETLPEKAGHYLSEITDSASQMGTLIDDLLQFSRTGRQEMHQADLDMNTVVKETIEQLKEDTKSRNISWSVAELPRIFGDYSLLKQVWINLLENAVKYTRDKDEAKIEVGCTREHDHWVFFIRDNGVGFDMQYAQKLFGVFQRLHSPAQFEGTGIGLAHVQRIVHKHGGRVWAEGWLDKGATFYFTIPRNTSDDGGTS